MYLIIRGRLKGRKVEGRGRMGEGPRGPEGKRGKPEGARSRADAEGKWVQEKNQAPPDTKNRNEDSPDYAD